MQQGKQEEGPRDWDSRLGRGRTPGWVPQEVRTWGDLFVMAISDRRLPCPETASPLWVALPPSHLPEALRPPAFPPQQKTCWRGKMEGGAWETW